MWESFSRKSSLKERARRASLPPRAFPLERSSTSARREMSHQSSHCPAPTGSSSIDDRLLLNEQASADLARDSALLAKSRRIQTRDTFKRNASDISHAKHSCASCASY
jgi:hypothetical protein